MHSSEADFLREVIVFCYGKSILTLNTNDLFTEAKVNI